VLNPMVAVDDLLSKFGQSSSHIHLPPGIVPREPHPVLVCPCANVAGLLTVECFLREAAGAMDHGNSWRWWTLRWFLMAVCQGDVIFGLFWRKEPGQLTMRGVPAHPQALADLCDLLEHAARSYP